MTHLSYAAGLMTGMFMVHFDALTLEWFFVVLCGTTASALIGVVNK